LLANVDIETKKLQTAIFSTLTDNDTLYFHMAFVSDNHVAPTDRNWQWWKSLTNFCFNSLAWNNQTMFLAFICAL